MKAALIKKKHISHIRPITSLFDMSAYSNHGIRGDHCFALKARFFKVNAITLFCLPSTILILLNYVCCYQFEPYVFFTLNNQFQ